MLVSKGDLLKWLVLFTVFAFLSNFIWACIAFTLIKELNKHCYVWTLDQSLYEREMQRRQQSFEPGKEFYYFKVVQCQTQK